MNQILFVITSHIFRYCDRTKKKKHVKSMMKLKFNIRNIKIILMILLNFWQCWTQDFLKCKAVADTRSIFFLISVTMKKPGAKFAYYFNKWSDTPFFYFNFSCFLFALSNCFFFSTQSPNKFISFTQQKISLLTEPALLRLATVICLKDWFNVQNIGTAMFVIKIKYWT